MTCSQCQKEIPEGSTYCLECGARQRGAYSRRRLMRSPKDKRIAGVCGGLAEFLDTDPTLVRLLWAVLAVVPGCLVGGVLAYVAAWIIVPKVPEPTTAPTTAKVDSPKAA